jgi:SAM-dependent methyltransferase
MQLVRNLMFDTVPSTLISFLKEEKYEFVTPTPATHSRNNQRAGNKQAQRLTDAFGWSRPFPSSLLPGPLFDLLRDSAVVFECEAGWKSSVRASTLDGELFLHSAFPTVSPGAVFFGPDTYRFARAIKNNLSSEPRPLRRALDLGCGSGAGGVILAKNSSCRELVMTDINDAALQMTRINADAAGVPNVITIHSDLFANLDGQFDMIVANPPYLNDPLQRAYRHGGVSWEAGFPYVSRDPRARGSPRAERCSCTRVHRSSTGLIDCCKPLSKILQVATCLGPTRK